MLVLSWNLFHGRAVPDAAAFAAGRLRRAARRLGVGRRAAAGGAAVVAGGARPCVPGQRAHRADLAQLAAAREPPGRRAAPRRDQVLGRRRQRDPRARRGRARAPHAHAALLARAARGARRAPGARLVGLQPARPGALRGARAGRRGARRGHARSRGRGRARSSSAATSTRAIRWCRASSSSPATASTTSSRDCCAPAGPGRTLERGRLSDHAPVLAHVA